MISIIVFWISITTIIYVYIGYPLLLGLVALFRGKPAELRDYYPVVTLLIAAYNEEKVVRSKIENSLKLDYPHDKLHVLFAADGSTDDTVSIIKGFRDKGVELSYSPKRRGKMAAIDNAMNKAEGDIIIMSDANNLYDPDTVKELVKPFVSTRVGAASGSKHIMMGDGTLGESEGLYWKYEDWIKRQESRLGTCTAASGEIFTFRKSLYSPPAEGIINDDFYMMMRIIKKGYKVAYVPQAKSYERISISPKDEIERRTRIVAGRFQAISLAGTLLPWNRPVVVWQVISHKFLRPLIPFFMIISFLANLYLVTTVSGTGSFSGSNVEFIYRLFFLFQCAFYSLAILGNLIPLPRILYLPTFLFNSNVAALRGFYRFIARRQPVLWKRAQRREDVSP